MFDSASGKKNIKKKSESIDFVILNNFNYSLVSKSVWHLSKEEK